MASDGVGKLAIERAEAMVAEERDAAVARVQAALRGAGAENCIDCSGIIPAARRAAVPGADRCVSCQGRWERRIGR